MFSRRRVFELLAGLGLVMGSGSAKSETLSIKIPPILENFNHLDTWVRSWKNYQEDGSPTAVCSQTGTPYTEVYAYQFFRPGDEAVAERTIARQMGQKISSLFCGRANGKVYWRQRLQYELSDEPQVIRYCEDGPDKDFYTDRNCIMDHNWKVIRAYCRMTITEEKI